MSRRLTPEETNILTHALCKFVVEMEKKRPEDAAVAMRLIGTPDWFDWDPPPHRGLFVRGIDISREL